MTATQTASSTQQSSASSIYPLGLMQRLLPWVFALTLIAGLSGVVQLASKVGQPFAGVVIQWRAEYKMLAIGWMTPTHWSGMLSGLQVNDKILCIDGYNPSPDSAVYGLDPRYEAYPCENGGLHYSEIFKAAYAGDGAVDFTVDRHGTILSVAQIPVVSFSFWSLVEMMLPSFLLGISLLAIGYVVFRAQPGNELNQVFAVFTLAAGGVAMSIVYSSRIVHKLVILPIFELVLQGPFFPLVGIVILHLSLLLSGQLTGSSWKRPALRVFYLLSLFFSIIGLYTYIGHDEPFGQQLLTAYLVFGSMSLLVCSILSSFILVWTALHTGDRRIRRQLTIMGIGFAGFVLLSLPYIWWLFISQPFVVRIDGWPYLGLAVVAIFAYAILRYQLVPTKSVTLSALLITVFCILVANIIFIPMGQTTAFLPLLMVALAVALGLEMRRGPSLLFTRELRREILDYERVTRFSQATGGLQEVDALIGNVRSLLAELLDVEYVEAYLAQEREAAILRVEDDLSFAPVELPTNMVTSMLSLDKPMRAGDAPLPADSLSQLTTRSGDIEVWLPLVHHGRSLGLLGIGPRWTGEPYNDQDMLLLSIIAGQTALAIANVRHLERLQEAARLNRQIQEREQSKIAGEIHSTIIPYLATLGFQVEKFRDDGTGASQMVDHLQDNIVYHTARLRELIRHLRAPETLIENGLIDTVTELAEQTGRQSDMQVTVECSYDEQTPPLSSESSLALYQVVREAINNAAKHSNASHIAVQIHDTDTYVEFAIQDDGDGFDLQEAYANRDKGYNSLEDMRMYIESVDGELSIRTATDNGTIVRGRIPIATE